MLEVTQHAPSTGLLALAVAQRRLPTVDSAELTDLILETSSDIEDYLNFAPWRQSYREARSGNGTTALTLVVPNVEPGSVVVTVDGEAFTDFTMNGSGILNKSSGSWNNGSTVVVTYSAGFVLEEWTKAWEATTGFAAAAWFYSVQDSLFVFEVTQGGTSGASTPDWASVAAAGEELTDGSVVWTARDAKMLPKSFQRHAWVAVHQAHASLTRTPGLTSVRVDGHSESYAADAHSSLPRAVMDGLAKWREVPL